jgi:hypothetical protein
MREINHSTTCVERMRFEELKDLAPASWSAAALRRFGPEGSPRALFFVRHNPTFSGFFRHPQQIVSLNINTTILPPSFHRLFVRRKKFKRSQAVPGGPRRTDRFTGAPVCDPRRTTLDLGLLSHPALRTPPSALHPPPPVDLSGNTRKYPETSGNTGLFRLLA